MIVEESIHQQEKRLIVDAMEKLDTITDRWHAYLIDEEEWMVEIYKGNVFSKLKGQTQLEALKKALVKAEELAKGYEKVNHPKHYGGEDCKHEAISVIEEWNLGFHLGNVVKYISRAGNKPNQSMLDDLKKAQWYLERRIEMLESDDE